MVIVGGFATYVRRGELLRSGSNVVLFALAPSVACGDHDLVNRRMSRVQGHEPS